MTTTDTAIQETIEEAKTQLKAAASAHQVQTAGKKAWQLLMQLEPTDEAFQAIDNAMRLATERIARAQGKAGPTRMYHHGHYLAPTPPVGYRVQCFLPDQKGPMGADVVEIEDAGKLQLRVIRPRQIAAHGREYQLAVLHVTAPEHESDPNRVKWDYLPDDKIPKSHWAYGVALIERREQNAIQAHERALASKIQHERQEAAAAENEPAAV